MSIADALLPEFDQEMATTRRLLERVPTDKGKWKPHPKSFPLGHLTRLVSMMPGWFTNAVTKTELNLGERGDQVFFTALRAAIVRQTINHLVHHRGQLTV